MTKPTIGEASDLHAIGIADTCLEGGKTIGVNILDGNIVNMALSRTTDIDQTDRTTTFDVAHSDASDGSNGVLAGRRDITPIAPHIGFECEDAVQRSGFATFDSNTIDFGTLALIGLDKKEVIELSCGFAIMHIDIVCTMGNLLSDTEECLATLGFATTYQYETRSIGIVPCLEDTTRFDGDDVTALIEITILDNEVT